MASGSRFFRSDAAADYVVLDWESGSLRWAAARISEGRITLLDSGSVEWPTVAPEDRDVAATVEQLRQALRGVSLKSPRALVVLPRDAMVVRKLELPSVPDNELPDLVRLQAATKLATPVDKLALDFLPLAAQSDKAGLSVLLVSVEQERLQKLRDAVHDAGLELVGCVTSSICVADLAVRSAGSGAASGLSLVVYQHRQRLELSALLDRQMIFSHSMTLPDVESAAHTQPLMAELSRVLVAVRQAHHESDIERVLVIQEGGRDEPVLAILRERFGSQMQLLSPEELGRGANLSGTVRPDVSAAAIGALAAEAAPLVPGIDFVRPRRTVPQADPRRRQLRLAGLAAGLLVLISGLTYYSMLSGRDAQIATLADRRAELDELLNEPESKAALAAAQTLNAWSSESSSPLVVLSDFQALLPGTERLYFSSLRFVPEAGDAVARLSGSGFARARRDVDDLFQRLSDSGYVVTSKPTTTSARNPDYPVAFELNVSVLPPPKVAKRE